MILPTGTPSTPDWHEPLQLQGFGLTLTPLQVGDAEAFLAALGTPEEATAVLEHLPYCPPDAQVVRRPLRRRLRDDHDRLAYAQRLTATGELVGTTSYYEINPTLRALAIGHTWVARRHWRSFVNTASKLIMLERAFDGLGAERVVWHTDILNVRSQAAISRLGAVREGVLRHHRIRRDGSWRDTVQFSMLRAEWPDARRRLETNLQSRSDQGD